MVGFHFFSFAPSRTLEPFVECIWGVRGSAHYHVEAVVPNGAMELMVNLGPEQRVVAYGDRPADDVFRRAWISGMQDRPLVHASPLGAHHLSIRFRPGGAHAFFDLSMDALTGQVVELEDVVGPRAVDGAWTRVREAESDLDRCRALEAWLLERRWGVHPYYGTVRRAMDLLRAGAYGTPVGDLCSRLGLSNRHLIAQFRRTVGLTPKTYARIGRFQQVVDRCRGVSDVAWSRVAFEHGYSDQSHLIREFRRFAGVTPGQFLEARTPDESHVVVA
jgi:AraC-like DNA-binding protein